MTIGQRPLRYIRVRVYREWIDVIEDILRREQRETLAALGQLRQEGLPEDAEAIMETRRRLQAVVRLLADIDEGKIDLAGPGDAGAA